MRTTLPIADAKEGIEFLPRPRPPYLFKHALAQEAAYQSLLLKTRREMHRRVGEVYEQLNAGDLDENAAVLARHYAGAGDYARVVELAARQSSKQKTMF